MKPPLKKPCKKCPFRRASVPGWLGDASPKEFLASTIFFEDEMPCHLTVDYSKRDWVERELPKARFCAGALIFSANICKSPRDKTRPDLPRDRETVFARPAEFLEHHEDWQKADCSCSGIPCEHIIQRRMGGE